MRKGQSLNLNWLFKPEFKSEYVTGNDYSDFERVHLPHTVKEIPYDSFDEFLFCFDSTYVRFFDLTGIEGKRVVLEFEGVSLYYDLYVNGQAVASHKGAYSTARFDITPYVHEGENKLVLMVDSRERDDIPPTGSTVDYLLYGGIYRDVTLYLLESAFAERFLFRYTLDGNCALAAPELFFDNLGASFPAQVEIALSRDGEELSRYARQITVPAGKGSVTLEPEKLPEIERWDLDSPVLYDVSAVISVDGREIDRCETRVGFRTLSVDAKGFSLNGRKVKLIGLNRHQSFPYVGYAMGRRPQRKDAEILRCDLGLNMVRCSHYMQSKYFLERCDELGLMVFEEIPGWGHIGDEGYKQVAFNDLEDMVLGHFNHPSIVIWGTRLNESADDDDFYRETNRRCKAMDPTRLTTGVRWHKNSPLFEDIYSFNDYTPLARTIPYKGEFMLQAQQQVTGLPYKVPYLISEHTGPLLDTRPSSDVPVQERFALYHASVVSKALCSDDYLGAIGWCMFDYNTHFDHAYQDKICYHGVLDMFRVPKYAAEFYRSQKDPSEEIVLEPCTVLGRGERGEGVMPFYVLTNCDYIDVTFCIATETQKQRYYPSSRFLGLKHAPIEVDGPELWFQPFWLGAKIEGYLGEELVAVFDCGKNPYLTRLEVAADDAELYCDRVDETRVVATFMDTNGHRMRHHFGVGKISVDGDIQLIGPDVVPVQGGTVAFWVKTKALGRKGRATVTVSACRDGVADETVSIELI